MQHVKEMHSFKYWPVQAKEDVIKNFNRLIDKINELEKRVEQLSISNSKEIK